MYEYDEECLQTFILNQGQLFDEHFLMSIATIAAIYLHDWKEAAGVMLFYQIGEYFQDKAVERSRASIGDLMNIRPEFAMVKVNDAVQAVLDRLPSPPSGV